MARKSRSKTTRRRSSGSAKFGTFLKKCHAKGKSLISTKGKRYYVRGHKGPIVRFTNAKRIANKIAYAGKSRRAPTKSRRSAARRRR